MSRLRWNKSNQAGLRRVRRSPGRSKHNDHQICGAVRSTGSASFASTYSSMSRLYPVLIAPLMRMARSAQLSLPVGLVRKKWACFSMKRHARGEWDDVPKRMFLAWRFTAPHTDRSRRPLPGSSAVPDLVSPAMRSQFGWRRISGFV